MIFEPFKILAPNINIFVRKWYGINTIFFHERMCGFSGAMDVEFFFEEMVHGAVQVEGISGWPRYTKFIVNIKTARTLPE